MRHVRPLLLGLAVLALAAAAWWWVARPVPVSVARPWTGSAARVVYAPGVVEPENWAKVTSLLRERIVEVAAREGAGVARGDLLLLLDDSEAQARLGELQARLDLANKELGRASDLLDRRVGSLQAYDQAKAEVAQFEASVAAATLGLRRYRITAPLDGQVLRLDGEVGEIAEPGTILAWVGRPTPLEVVAEVNEEDVPRVEAGQQALIKADAFPGEAIAGEVAMVTPMGDPKLRTYRVRIGLPDDTPLRVGMSVEANIVTRTVAGALLIPPAALKDGRVLVVEDGRAVAREVETGIVGLDAVQVTRGIGAEALVVSPWPEGLDAGARVEPGEGPGEAGSGREGA